MRTVVLAIAIGSLIVGLPVTRSAGAPPAAARLGAALPLTGRYANGGSQVRAGYQYAEEDINARGGGQVGRQRLLLELTILDDEPDPTSTVSRFSALAAQTRLTCLRGV